MVEETKLPTEGNNPSDLSQPTESMQETASQTAEATETVASDLKAIKEELITPTIKESASTVVETAVEAVSITEVAEVSVAEAPVAESSVAEVSVAEVLEASPESVEGSAPIEQSISGEARLDTMVLSVTPEITETTIGQEPLIKELPTTPGNYCGELQEAIEVGAMGLMDKQVILEELKQLANSDKKVTREQIEKLKQAYYRIDKAENEELKKVFLENGGEEEDFIAAKDESADTLKELLAQLKEKRAEIQKEESKAKEANYAKKLQLIERLSLLVESQDDFNKRYNEFKEIQQQWKEYDPIPQEHVKELWRNYQIESERFYDLVRINNQFRDYDFKKNLALKTALCEAVEKLVEEPDAISAYHQLQKLFQQWREIGPVARDIREELWARFKTASTIINKKHQTYFETLRNKEEENLQAKQALCEEIESIDYELLKTFKEWENKTKEVIETQNRWKMIGFATKKQNTKIFERFRAACDLYFEKKGLFYQTIKKELEHNLQLKRQLVEKAEALKMSTDWKTTTKEMIEIQHEWKKIGPVSRKHSDAVWKQFIGACDYFFEQKNKTFSSHKTEELANLEAKNNLIAEIKAIGSEEPNSESLDKLRSCISRWSTIGHVPYKEKDTVYKAFSEAVDAQYDRLNVAHADRRMQQFRSTLSEYSSKGKEKLHGERDRLMRTFDRMKNELSTYENNIGFLTISSKGGGGLLKEMERKIEHLKKEMALIVKKIDAIDETLE